jgi:hypothetical protein
LIADIFAAFRGKGFGEFLDIDKLTMFPDYRVPQILHHHGVLAYSEQLLHHIKNLEVIPHGSSLEIEIRAATVVAVEEIKHHLNLMTIEVDWILW